MIVKKSKKTLTNPTNMQYHHNAKTNMAQRQAIKEARSTPHRTLAKQYCVSHTTVGKWKNSNQVKDHIITES
jgi:hypothetical protein